MTAYLLAFCNMALTLPHEQATLTLAPHIFQCVLAAAFILCVL